MADPAYSEDNWCFACGKENPIGLKLKFEQTEDGVRTTIVLDRVYQGWPGIAHGGIVATLLDEAIAHAVMTRLGPAVTGELVVRLRRHAPIGQPLSLSARIISRKGRLVQAEATLASETDGKALATGQGKFMLVNFADRQ
ncbi:MAG: PaaI family thioesterase [Chloroflexi bacterium]|nr:PaaI family thioesterase [Chloroflexota bacterium]